LSWTAAHEERIAAEAIRNGLPLASTWRSFATSGALLAYGPKRQLPVAPAWPAQVDKLLKGAQPGDLAVEQPTQFDLIINTKTAKALGVKIPESVMLRATENDPMMHEPRAPP
jgi:putative ABC transport system substrate-binding protein